MDGPDTPVNVESLEHRTLLSADGMAAAGQLTAAGYTPPAVEVALSPDVGEAPTGEVVEAVQKLVTDIRQIASESEITDDMIQDFRAALVEVVDGAQLPDRELVEAFVDDVTAALEDGEISPIEMVQLTQSFTEVLASSNITVEELQAVGETLRVIVDASNVDQQDLQLIADDLRGIADAVRDKFDMIRDRFSGMRR